MPKRIQVENQIIEFPDNISDDEIATIIKKEFYLQPQQQPQLPQEQLLQQQQIKQKEKQQIANEEGRIGSLFTTGTNILPGMVRAKALSAALGAKAMGGDETIGNFYDEALKNELTKLSIARDKYPIQSLASELLGGAGIVGKGLKAAGLGGSSLKSMVAGGGLTGATYAAGETRNLKSSQAIKDAATGGLIGAGGGALVKGVSKILPVVNKSLETTATTIKNTVKPSAEKILKQVFTPELAKQEASKLVNKIAKGRITNLPEQGGDVALDLTKLVGKTKGGDKILQNYYNTKSAGSARRVGDILEKDLSAKNYFDSLDDAIARQKELSTPLYKKAFKEGDIALKEAMSLPSTGNVKVGRARELIEDDRIKNAILSARKDYGINKEIPDISIQSLHGARQVVDDIIGSAKRTGENNKARSYIDLKNKINDVIYSVAPTMQKADKTFATEARIIEAHKKGLEFNKFKNADEIKRYLKPLTQAEKEGFIIGAKASQYDKMLKSSDTNPAKAIFGNQLERSKIKALFNNLQEYTNFAKRLNDEMRVINTKQKIVGGTNDFNLKEGEDILNKITTGAINYKTFGIGNVLLMTKDAIKKKYLGLNENTAKDLANILIDPNKTIKELNKIAVKTPKEKNLIKKFANDYLKSKNITNAISTTAGKLSAQKQEE